MDSDSQYSRNCWSPSESETDSIDYQLSMMESPLEILSLAAHLVDRGMTSTMRNIIKRARPSSGNSCNYLRQQKRNSAPQLPTPNLVLDEPLDMSLKSRKRAASGDFYSTTCTKKYRPSVISFVPIVPNEAEQQQQQGYTTPTHPQIENHDHEQQQKLQLHVQPMPRRVVKVNANPDKVIKLGNKNKTAGTGSMATIIAKAKSYHSRVSKSNATVNTKGKSKAAANASIPIRTTPSLIITPEYTEQGIDEHFRKSLKKYVKEDDESSTASDQENIEKWNAEVSVESHFIRSLGYDQWNKIKEQYKLKKGKEAASCEQLATI